jgi:hypothetical protein
MSGPGRRGQASATERVARALAWTSKSVTPRLPSWIGLVTLGQVTMH